NLGAVVGKIFNPDVPATETIASYWYFAIALFGAAMTPYEVFFYSSGAVEERWSEKDLSLNKVTAYIGFAFGAFLAASAIAVAAQVFKPLGISVDELSQVALGPAKALGTVGLIAFLVGLFASTFGAALEVSLSTGYSIAQFFGWTWGKFEDTKSASRFHLSIIVLVVVATLTLFTSVDPVKVTEIAVIFSAIALPLTYIPILIVSNDREYLGDHANGRVLNAVGSAYLVIVTIAALAAIPLMIWTKMGS
ncbi:MAG TPA: divalent metal cation transporter, partial [Actinomycetota bacterium]|nr:divalent metal cation transporter [Actinomycetota bacterium]